MDDLILLANDPAEAGRCYGETAAPALRERVGRMRRAAAAGPWSGGQLAERAARFRAFVGRVAPHWLDEARAAAAAAGIGPDDLFVLNALPEGFWDHGTGGCTSCIAVGRAAGGATLLHKNRDIRAETQDLHVRRAAGGARLLASRDVGNLGFAHFHSGRALAGGNNTGSPIAADEFRPCGLNCCHLLRLVAERAASCDEALAVLDDALARGVAGGSAHRRGMIFLFAEPGRGLVVEMTSRRLAHQEVRHGLLVRTNHFLLCPMVPYRATAPNPNTRRRYDRAHELLDPLDPVAVPDLVRMSRDHNDGPDSICCDDREHFWMTQTACTHVVGEASSAPLPRTMASVGNTRNTLCIPLPRDVDGLPSECVSGQLHVLSRRLYARHGLGGHLAPVQAEHEPHMAGELQTLARTLADASPRHARAQLTAFAAGSIARVRTVLRAFLDPAAPAPTP